MVVRCTPPPNCRVLTSLCETALIPLSVAGGLGRRLPGLRGNPQQRLHQQPHAALPVLRGSGGLGFRLHAVAVAGHPLPLLPQTSGARLLPHVLRRGRLHRHAVARLPLAV